MKLNGKKIKYGLLTLIAAAIAIQALLIPIKAYCAHWLIERSWSNMLSTGASTPPWPWADHYPLLKLQFPTTSQSYTVLMGADPSSLAFAPGIMHEFSNTTQTGALVVAGHNDTHFSFLPRLSIGDQVIMTNNHNTDYHYQIDTIAIVDTKQQSLALTKHDNRLVLITCYPFTSSVESTSKRFIVSAIPVNT